MGSVGDRSWVAEVCSRCDSVFESAAVGFERQSMSESGRVTALLWEADPERFAQRYPDSGIIESYGLDQWPPPCIDFWVYVDTERATAEISVEGRQPSDTTVNLTGDGVRDGVVIGELMARLLGVPPPQP